MSSEGEREADLARREADVEAREAALAARVEATQEILTAADQRDVVSDARDVEAEHREQDLDLAEMLASDDEYGEHWPERRNAGLDRGHSKGNRAASHDDRIALTEDQVEPETDETDET